MADQRIDGIAWTDETWNPIRGCESVSEECRFCYAAELAARFSGEGLPFAGLARRSAKRGLPQWTGKTMFIPERLGLPLKWKRPRRIFVTSVSDLFHGSFTNEQIAAVFGVMAAAPRHTFQLLTKRPERALEWFQWVGLTDKHALVRIACYAEDHLMGLMSTSSLASALAPGIGAKTWPLPNVHLLVSAGTQASADKFIPTLLEIPATVRGVSCEPLLEPVNLRSVVVAQEGTKTWSLNVHCGWSVGTTRHRIDWVIVGGESGPRARQFDLRWARDIVAQCRRAGVPVFVKQMGERPVDACFRCVGKGHVHGYGEHGADPEWCPECGGDGTDWLKLRDKKGGDPSEWPEDLRVREFPR